MAANTVVIRDEKEWEIISGLLEKLQAGGVIIPPEKCDFLDENFPGWEDHVPETLDYDFDGPFTKVTVVEIGNKADSLLDDVLIEAQHTEFPFR